MKNTLTIIDLANVIIGAQGAGVRRHMRNACASALGSRVESLAQRSLRSMRARFQRDISQEEQRVQQEADSGRMLVLRMQQVVLRWGWYHLGTCGIDRPNPLLLVHGR